MNSYKIKGAPQDFVYLKTLRDDFLNLAHSWIYSVLFYQQLYPQSTFEFRTTYGVQIPVSVSQKVNNYIEGFFKEIENNVGAINKLEILIYDNGIPNTNFVLLADFPETQCFNNRHQKQTEFKHFLSQLIKQLQIEPIQNRIRTFDLFVEYRSETGKAEKIKTGKFIDKWILQPSSTSTQNEFESDETVLGKSLQLPDFSVMCLRKKIK